MKTIRFLFGIALLGSILWAPGAWAQFSGTVTGTVVDPSGAVVPNANVKLTNEATGQSNETK
jgi:hypothetical protein